MICSHKGAPRLSATLGHLAVQGAPAGLGWEVLVIDNASTNDTAAVARGAWPSAAPAPLRIVVEPRLGLGHARARGLTEARYEVVSFVDDDKLGRAGLDRDGFGRHARAGAWRLWW